MQRFAIGFLFVVALILPAAHVNAALPSVAPAACTNAPIAVPPPGEVGDLTLPSPVATAIDESGAKPADQATIDAVTAPIVQAVACQNAGDVLRMLASFSDRWIAERFSGYDLVFYGRFLNAAESATPAAVSSQVELVTIEDVRVRTDGTVLATVVTSSGGEQQRDLLVLIESAGGWKIDGSQSLD